MFEFTNLIDCEESMILRIILIHFNVEAFLTNPADFAASVAASNLKIVRYTFDKQCQILISWKAYPITLPKTPIFLGLTPVSPFSQPMTIISPIVGTNSLLSNGAYNIGYSWEGANNFSVQVLSMNGSSQSVRIIYQFTIFYTD